MLSRSERRRGEKKSLAMSKTRQTIQINQHDKFSSAKVINESATNQYTKHSKDRAVENLVKEHPPSANNKILIERLKFIKLPYNSPPLDYEVLEEVDIFRPLLMSNLGKIR